MNKLLVTTAVGTILALATSPTMAFDYSSAAITQSIYAAQTALNQFSLVTNDDGPTVQKAINAANLVDYAGAIGSIGQTAGAVQNATNTGATVWGALHSLTQNATNVANSVQLSASVTWGDLQQLQQTVASTGNQSAHNLIKTQEGLDPGATQTATNAANVATVRQLITSNQGVEPITQNALNEIIAAQSSQVYSPIDNTTQSATNVANALTATDVFGAVAQGSNSTQIAHNYAQYQLGYTLPMWSDGQMATNAANIANLHDVAATVTQSVAPVSQTALNEIVPVQTVNLSAITSAVQEATNVSNAITAHEVAAIVQSVSGSQFAHNQILFGSDTNAADPVDLINAKQTATNVSDLVTLSSLDNSLSQTSTLGQNALNEAIYVGLVPNPTWTDGMVNGLNQTSLNALNVVTASSLGNFATISQVANNGSQAATNTLTTIGGISGIVQNATNVANSFATPTP